MSSITSFVQNFTLTEGLTISISLVAIIISIISFFKTASSDRRQIRINKIEEMVEIVILIMGDYHIFDDLFLLQQVISITEDSIEKAVLQEKEKRYIETLKNISDEIKLREKLIRLNVLANSYIPNGELKNRIRFFVSIISTIYEATVNQNYSQTKSIFRTYPRAWDLLKFVEKLQLQLGVEMQLGYESNFFNENQFHEKFMEELRIK
jgi:hypothetical protein